MMKAIACMPPLLVAGVVSGAEPVSIFDGESLDGWKVEGASYWTAADGVLTGRSDEAKEASVVWTEKAYEDFVLTFEFRFEGDIDSGVFLRTEDDQIQIGVSRSLERDMTGSPYIAPERGYPVEAEGVDELLEDGAWNRMRIEAAGPRYTVGLNGEEVMTYTSDSAKEEGPIGLQIHAGLEMAISFRNLALTPGDRG